MEHMVTEDKSEIKIFHRLELIITGACSVLWTSYLATDSPHYPPSTRSIGEETASRQAEPPETRRGKSMSIVNPLRTALCASLGLFLDR